MHAPVSAATAAPLHLYDYTHGMRRLSLWRESDPAGQLMVAAAIAVPVTLQAPGEAPEVEWWPVVECGDYASAMRLRPVYRDARERLPDRWKLDLGDTEFDLFAIEADAIASYFGMDIDTREDAP